MKNEPSSGISDEGSEVGCECVGGGRDKERRNKNVYSHKRCGEEIDARKRNRVYRSSIAKNEVYTIGWKETRGCQKEDRSKNETSIDRTVKDREES